MKSPTSTSTLKTVLVAAALAIGACVSTPFAAAQSNSTVALVNIPFGFHAGEQRLPAGEYRISRATDHLVLLRGPGSAATFMMVQDARSAQPHSQSVVVFHRYGSSYFLREIWTGGSREGLESPKNRAEKEMLLGQNKLPGNTTELAFNSVPPR